MATMLYVVNKDWDALNNGDPATYETSTQEWTYGLDAYASIYQTILDGNNIKIPGAVNPGNGLDPESQDYIPATLIPCWGEGEPVVINVINGNFVDNAFANANANYTLDFSSIYNIPSRPDLNTSFVGSFVSEAVNNVGFRVSSGPVNFGETIVYKKNEDGQYVAWDAQTEQFVPIADQDHPEDPLRPLQR